jgi:glyoxylase-like metal-dependent hydrolase (beta-lactamase superfamily II)
MLQVKAFPNNPFEENTYIVFEDGGHCAIIDPGMYDAREQNAVVNFIKQHNLTPVMLLNTHCHIDHILGNKFVFDQYGLKPQFHQGELDMFTQAPARGAQFGLRYEVSPAPDTFLPEAGTIALGASEFQLIFAPGHSPAHLCFYAVQENFVIGGDVLFRGSIGRTDLPGGSFQLLHKNIEEKLFTLPDDCIVYPGHGGETTIGFEKLHNPFFN